MSRRRGMAGAAAAAVVAVSAATVAIAQRSEEGGTRLQERLDAIVEAGAPGALALVRTPDRTWRGASGTADVASGAPMRPGLRFRIGSITKTFVGAAVLRLAVEGRLDLDDPVERWSPGTVPRGITIRHLLAHTSGLFDYTALPEFTAGRPRELVATAIRRPRAFSPPGSGYHYSSTNYLVLGFVVEAAAGATLESVLEKRVFAPLGLRATALVPGPLSGDHVHGFRPPVRDGIVVDRPGVDTSVDPAAWAGAAGALVSTADDTARFFAALLGGRLVPRPFLRPMTTPTVASGGRYGLGLAVFRTPCGPAWGHTGNLLGHVSVVWGSRDGRRVVVLAANSFPLGADGERAARAFLEAAYCGE